MSPASASTADAVLLMGPTCTGKTRLALRLAQEFPVEIISVDSALVYRGMDIGTSKPAQAEQAAVRHHLVDICDPAESYSAGRFLRDASRLIEEVRARGRAPLLVGGTMLYFRALTRGLAPLPEADPQLRARIDQRASEIGWAGLHEELAERDPAAAQRIRPADSQRIQRALEVLELSGQPLSVLQKQATPTPFSLAAFALMPLPREVLYQRIERRFDAMMSCGFLDEVRALHERPDLHAGLPSIRAVGYRQLWAHLEGHGTLAEAVEAGKRATRNLAKRQMTWLRAEQGMEWLRTLDDQELAPMKSVLKGMLAA